MPNRIFFGALAVSIALSFGASCGRPEAGTEIAKWQDGKAGAVSLTFDDNSANQFRVAVPLMTRLGFPATFHIITGEIAGSRFHGTFVGRPFEDILEEAARVPTGPGNLFERASAVARLGLRGAFDYHLRAGELYEKGKTAEACRLIDEALSKVRGGLLEPESKGPARPAGTAGTPPLRPGSTSSGSAAF